MISHLVKREFIKANNIDIKKNFFSIASIVLKVLFFGAFIALECYVLLTLNKKINEYSPYGSYDFFILYNFIITILVSLYLVFKARGTLFDEQDSKIMMVLPVNSGKVVFSKAIWLYCISSFYLLVLGTPSLLCYASTLKVYSYFYVFCFVYPLLISFFTVGLALILVPLVELIYRFIKNFNILQFLLACGLVIGLCFGYQFVLNLFLTALNNSSVGGMFDYNFIESLHKITKGFIPIIHVFNPILSKEMNISSIYSFIIFIVEIIAFNLIGIVVANYAYDYFNVREMNYEIKNKKNNEIKITSPFKELIRKEYMLIFRDKGYIFSYTSLLIMAPFLAFVVISSLNSLIYKNLVLFSSYFPEMINGLNIVLILLFISVINSSASLSISREDKMIQISKYIPVSYSKQIFAKLIAPLTLSFISLIITSCCLYLFNVITLHAFLMALSLGLICIITNNILAIERDMHDLSDTTHKLKSLNSVFSIGFPLLILIIHFILTFTKCDIYIIYPVETGIALVLLIGSFVNIRSRYKKAFNRMEVN